jgi:hypothetical protein
MNVSQSAGIPNISVPDPLSAEHVAYLSARAVNPDYARFGAKLRTVSASEGARLLGFDGSLASQALLVPYPNVPGYVRVRLDKEGHYLVPKGREVPVYIPRDCPRLGLAPLFVVEGPVKALALQDHGFDAIALGGVSTTLTDDGKLNESWRDVTVCRRDIFIVFDANRRHNVSVARAEARLVLALEKAGARVRLVALPFVDGDKDQGPDDFLATYSDDHEPLRALVAEAVTADPFARAVGVATKAAAFELLKEGGYPRRAEGWRAGGSFMRRRARCSWTPAPRRRPRSDPTEAQLVV